MADDAPPGGFSDTARIEFNELLAALIDRAHEVLRTQSRLQGLVRATQSIASNLELPTLLQLIVEEARTLIGARYAALGVIGEDGSLVEFVHSGMDPETVALIGHLPTGGGLLGQVIADPRPLRLRHLAEHEISVGFPAGHPPMESFLGVPVRIRSQVFGNLYLTEKPGGAEFTAEDEALALSLAAAAAAAIDNARLFGSLSRREHWLNASRSVTNALLDVTDHDEALRLVTRAVRVAADADFAAVLAESPGGEMRFAAADTGADLAEGEAEKIIGLVPPAEFPALLAIREREPVRVEDLSTRGEVGELPGGLAIGPLVAVPLSARNQVHGALVVGNLPGKAQFTRQDTEMVQEFATQAALVLLVSASQAAAKQVELADERARIARDLHDHAIQGIFGVGLGLNGLAARVGGPDGDRMVELVDQLDGAVRAIRHSIFALQKPPDDNRATLRLRLMRALDGAADILGFPPGLHTEGPVDSLVPDEIAEDLLAVLREALSNVARHARASRTEVYLSAGSDVVLEIRDDGCGIGHPARASGLTNMSSRAQRHGGSCQVTGTSSTGTTVRWSVPLPVQPRDLGPART